MEKSIQLTQYLYNKYDIEFMILWTLIQRNNFDELLFWISEYYHSGYQDELWELIIQIYFDIYALTHPYFYKYLIKKRNAFDKSKSIALLLDVIKNMYYMKSTPYLFEFRLCFQSYSPSKICKYKGRKPSWLNDFHKDYKNIMYALNKNDANALVYYFNNVNKDGHEVLFDQLIRYCEIFCKSKENSSTLRLFIQQFQKFKKKFLMKYLNIVILYLIIIEQSKLILHNKQTYIKVSEKELQLFTGYHKVHRHIYDWKFLKSVCKFSVVDYVHVFNNSRKDISYKDLIRYNWEYYAFDSPIWKSRFECNNAYKNENTKSVVFKTDFDSEKFYQNYGLEPDEQDTNTQNTFIQEYKCVSIKQLFNSLWNYNSEVLDEDYCYNLRY